MPISERDRPIFEPLTRRSARKRAPARAPLRDIGTGWRPPLGAMIAGLVPLTAAVATDTWWIGLAGLPLGGILASTRVFGWPPHPIRRRLRVHKALPVRADSDPHGYGDTIVPHRTYLPPARRIIAAIALVLVPVFLFAAMTGTEATQRTGARPAHSDLIGSRPGWG